MKFLTFKITYIVGLISLAIAKDKVKVSSNKDLRVLLKGENYEEIKVEKNRVREVQEVKPAQDDDQAPPTDDDQAPPPSDDDQAPPPTDDGSDDGDDDVVSPTPGNCGIVRVKIVTDNYPTETSFEVVNLNGNAFLSVSDFTEKDTEYIREACLPYATYNFIIRDSYGDGMCCEYGNGSYELSVSGEVIKTGGQFESSETTQFSTNPGQSPTAAPGPCFDVTVVIKTDRFPKETSFSVVNSVGIEVMSGGLYEEQETEYAQTSCLSSSNSYTFTIFDTYGDGICCEYGDGFYTLTVDGSVIKSGGEFGESESTSFGASSSDIDVLVRITTDNYPEETSYKVTSQTGAVFMEGGGFTEKLTTYTDSKSLKGGNDYTFTIFDDYNDGMCCRYGNGSYEVSVNGKVIKTGGEFGASESTSLSEDGSDDDQAPPSDDDQAQPPSDDDQAQPPSDDDQVTPPSDDDQAQVSYTKPEYVKPKYVKPKYEKPKYDKQGDGN